MQRLQTIKKTFTYPQIYDYIIIGGGISGLQAAQILTQSTTNLLILQAQDYLGGRISTMSITDLPSSKNISWIIENKQAYNKVKIQKGATWIEQRHYVLRQICKQYNIPLKIQFSQGNSTYLAEKSYTNAQLLNREQYSKQIKIFLNKIDQLADQYNKIVLSSTQSSTNQSQQYKKMLKLYDSMTVSQYLQKQILSKHVRDFIQNFLQHTECISCDINSMHEVLTKHARSNDIGILKQFLGIDQHQPSYLLEGTDTIIKKFIQIIQTNIKGIKQNIKQIVKYSTQVIEIDNSKNQITVLTCLSTKNNKPFKIFTKKVISAVPLQLIRNINFTNISQNKRIVFDNQLRTNALKTFVIFKKPFWRQFNYTGDGLFSYQWNVNMCHDISPQDDSCGILVFFHNGRKYYQWKRMFSFNLQQAYLQKKQYMGKMISKMFKVNQNQNRQIYKENFNQFFIGQSGFMENPYIRSGFQSNTRPGTFTKIIQKTGDLNALYNDQTNIIFIGSEFSDSFASYIEGAIRITRKKIFNLIGKKDPNKNLVQSVNQVAKKNY